ncbi:MAG: helix-turn-helix transcriptional regulator [Ruminococcaceae bacterium]|nr:helix-turn-helix transcriptional regulator [Oscillospiraceae bacterium]
MSRHGDKNAKGITDLNSFDQDKNICKFASPNSSDSDLFAFQFIYETMPQRLENPRTYPAFCCCLMTQGTASLETEYGSYPVIAGDVFFTFPASQFSIVNCSQAQYLYIAFVGSKATEFLESVGVSRKNPVRSGFSELNNTWFYGILKASSTSLPLLAKGLLLYTASFLSDSQKNDKGGEKISVASQIRSDIDCCYANTELSLEYLCDLHSYNSKYVSRKFKEEMGVSFSEYLESCRIHHACNLLASTSRPINEIASAVGYKDSMYFSKVFKKRNGISPSEFRSSQIENKEYK